MAIIKPAVVKSSGSDREFELVPAGLYLARCYRTVDEGTHTDVFPGQSFEPKPTRRVIFYWELLQDNDGAVVTMSDGRPFTIQKRYTKSLHERAALRKDLELWRGAAFTKEQIAEGYDYNKCIGKFCLIQVVHTVSADGTATFANVSAILPTKKTADPVNEDTCFVMDDPDWALFETFSDKLKERIMSSNEMAGKRPGQAAATPAAAAPDSGEELPWDDNAPAAAASNISSIDDAAF